MNQAADSFSVHHEAPQREEEAHQALRFGYSNGLPTQYFCNDDHDPDYHHPNTCCIWDTYQMIDSVQHFCISHCKKVVLALHPLNRSFHSPSYITI